MNNNKVEVLWISRYDYPAGWGIKNHAHDFYQMYYVLSGQPKYCYNGEYYDLDEDLFLLILPNVTHNMPKLKNGSIKIIDIKFYVYDDMLKKQLVRVGGPNKSYDYTIRSYLEKIREEGKHKDTYFIQIANNYLEYILFSILRGNESTVVDTQPVSYENKQSKNSIAKMVIEYLDKNYMKNISLCELSQVFDYNKNYICQKFTEETGITMRQYLNQLRVSKSKELITFSNYDLKQISSIVGFDNIHYFSAVFKNLTGLAPGSFRERELEELRKGIFFGDDYINVEYHDI
jgi:Response regulator containing CheY-like receiver domain and AraC-type DNA-binding domain